MPTYEYECTNCGEIFELVQPITEPARRRLRKEDPRPCECNAAVRRRIGTGGAVIFKGSGFYETDYRSESYKKAAKADKESTDGKSKSDKDGKSGAGAGTTSETKSTGAAANSASKPAAGQKDAD